MVRYGFDIRINDIDSLSTLSSSNPDISSNPVITTFSYSGTPRIQIEVRQITGSIQ